jgi:hypothetical protein
MTFQRLFGTLFQPPRAARKLSTSLCNGLKTYIQSDTWMNCKALTEPRWRPNLGIHPFPSLGLRRWGSDPRWGVAAMPALTIMQTSGIGHLVNISMAATDLESRDRAAKSCGVCFSIKHNGRFLSATGYSRFSRW